MKKEFKMSFWGRRAGGFSLIYYLSTDTTLVTGYDIHLSCATIADHVTLLAIFLLKILTAGCSKESGNFAKNDSFFFF